MYPSHSDTPSPLPPDARWHVLHTLARQEKALANDLAARSIEHYLPLQASVRYYGRRKVTSELPVFPGYVFLHGSLDDAYLADRTKRVARIIQVSDQQRLQSELAQIRRALDAGLTLSPYAKLVKGTRVEVNAGPLRGMIGEVEDQAKPDRLILRIKTLGQAVSLNIEAGLLERLETLVA
jgi:transcriptional antiterminator RfaH